MLRPAFVAFAVTIALEPLLLFLLRRYRVIDVPNARSSHDRPTPRGGGLAPVAGVLIALATSPDVAGSVRVGLVVATVAFGVLGLVDDLTGFIPPLARLGLQAVAVGAALPWLLDALAGPVLLRLLLAAVTAVWMIGYVNAFNFMDGINGISAAQAVGAGLIWYGVGTDQEVTAFATGGLVLAGAALAFTPFNFPHAYVFLGDVGSYGLGAFMAALAVIGLRAGIPPEAVLAPLTLYVADTGATLVRRLARREVLYQAHREHVYQRLVASGMSHSAVTLSVLTFVAACGVLGALSLRESAPARIGGGLGIVVVIAGYLSSPALVERFRSVPERR